VNFSALRKSMVNAQLKGRGIKDERVLAVFSAVARHEFVPPELMRSAYEDCPLSIGSGQTISQPYMVALMTELLSLKPQDRVLEIGTGSGYQTAILAKLAACVYSVERIEKLANATKTRLQNMGYRNIHIHLGDGSLGLEEFKPYDAIIVTAAAPEVPASLLGQLKEGGRLVVPVGRRMAQALMCYEKKEANIQAKEICDCIFVPLLGQEEWKIERE